ncbi:cation:proton antiporter [Anaerofustis stercorihominis]|nr:cation:proton antiporter [Anaerofustis stercorihominis]
MTILIIRLIMTIIAGYFAGELISKIKLPKILGWLIAGMILGPHALSLTNHEILNAKWYNDIIHIMECAVGLMIGTELVWNKIKKSGKAIVFTTLTQSLGTFLFVSIVFSIVFYIMNIPIYMAFIFGSIALATAPAPALSIVREFKTKGPVTNTLIPMAALDDMVGVVVFFTTISVVSSNISKDAMPIWLSMIIVFLPIIIGAVTSMAAGHILKRDMDKSKTMIILISFILLSSFAGFIFNNYILSSPVLNFMLIGMAFSAAYSNIVPSERLKAITKDFNPILNFSILAVILNLGYPLDYHLILGAGLFTAVYIISRAIGKYFGAYFGSSVMKSPISVKKFLGLTLLPHSGVSLVFTGIAASALASPAPESCKILQGTIAAAAVINEVIAVIIAKKGFEWSGELNKV